LLTCSENHHVKSIRSVTELALTRTNKRLGLKLTRALAPGQENLDGMKGFLARN
jgi:hypothetical protein